MPSNQPPKQNTSQTIVQELDRVVEPVVDAGKRASWGDFEPLLDLLSSVGITEEILGEEIEFFVDKVTTVAESYATVESVVAGGTEDLDVEDVDDVLTAISDVVEAIRAFNQVELDVRHDELSAVGDNLVDHLLVTYLRDYHDGVLQGLVIADVVHEQPSGNPDILQLEKIGAYLSNPMEATFSTFNWGEEEFLGFSVVYYVSELLWSVNVPSSIDYPDADDVVQFSSYSQSEFDQQFDSTMDLDPQLELPVVTWPGGRVGLRLLPLPGKGTNPLPGLAVVPFGVVSKSITQPLGGGWSFNVGASGEADDWGLVLRPDDPPAFESPESGVGGEFTGEASLKYDQSGSEPSKRTLLGSPDATRIELHSVAAKAGVDFTGDDVVFRVELPASGRFVLEPEGGFLETVIPESIEFDFDASVGWSNKDGLYFEGGGTLEAAIPTHIDLGFASLEELFLAVNLQNPDSDFTIETATSPKLSLGPLKGSVKRMGLKADVSFPKDRDGSMGILDLDLDFRPPDGLALSIDTGAVTGGGFMVFEPEKHRYAGGLELQFASWGLTVVGLLNTEVPGTDGYSLLLLVTADLPPIQLGFGFVLNGIGGLAGIHRGFKTKPLGKAVRSGNLDSVLFPENVVENADQIVTDLRAIFPPKADKHVFGPMVRLGWGTPVIITAELGVLVAIPDWKIALLGKFMVDLPDEEVALVDINLAVVGILDVPGKELSIDASLYDSRVIQWTLSGDMAMRLSWGADSRFMLSVGGFHPKYDPPKSFPELDRVTATMAPPGGNPRLEYSGYFAVTPNTFQVGAGALLRGDFGPAKVKGELSFDALFRFNPFEFQIDFLAKVSVTVKDMGFGLELDGHLSGPRPYHVKGKLKIQVLLLKVTVKVDAKFGPKGGSKELPTANVLPELVEALETPANWSAQDPAGVDQLVTLRDPDAGNEREQGEPTTDTLLAHPLGTLSVRQQVVPLDTTIEKFGNARPAHTRFSVSNLSVTGIGEDLGTQEPLTERFAPARFRKMTDAEKMQAQEFAEFPAGRTVGNGAVHYAGRDDPELLSWATLAYEASVIDAENEHYRTSGSDVDDDWDGTLGLAQGHAMAEQSAVATAETRTTGPQAYANPDQSLTVSVDEQRYVVAWTDSLERLDVAENPASGQTQVDAQDTLRAYVADNDATETDLQVVGVQEIADAAGGGSS